MAVEAGQGRVRKERWGPRTLDLDLLVFGEQILETPDLQVPHPRMYARVFVLVPLRELAPDLVLPRWHKTAGVLLSEMPPGEREAQKVEKTAWDW